MLTFCGQKNHFLEIFEAKLRRIVLTRALGGIWRPSELIFKFFITVIIIIITSVMKSAARDQLNSVFKSQYLRRVRRSRRTNPKPKPRPNPRNPNLDPPINCGYTPSKFVAHSVGSRNNAGDSTLSVRLSTPMLSSLDRT